MDWQTRTSAHLCQLFRNLVHYCEYPHDDRFARSGYSVSTIAQRLVLSDIPRHLWFRYGKSVHSSSHKDGSDTRQQFLLAAGLQYEKSSRATNMVYVQMLFALSFDKLIWGTTPGALSIIGSSLILGSAIYVAMNKEAPQTAGATRERGDQEEGQGLMASDPEMDQDGDGQSIQLTSVRG